MTAADFRNYVNLCRQRGLADYHIASMLGCGLGSVVNWKRYDPPRYIGLAIAALENNLKEWEGDVYEQA